MHDNDGLLVANNLLSGPPMRIETTSRWRNVGNVTTNLAERFIGAEVGNLHLKAAVPGIVEGAERLPEAGEDIDHQSRKARSDVGADEFAVRTNSGPGLTP